MKGAQSMVFNPHLRINKEKLSINRKCLAVISNFSTESMSGDNFSTHLPLNSFFVSNSELFTKTYSSQQ